MMKYETELEVCRCHECEGAWPYPNISLERVFPLNDNHVWECRISHENADEEVDYATYNRDESYITALNDGIKLWNDWNKKIHDNKD